MDNESARNNMVTKQLMARGITDPAVLAAMGRIPRERFLPDSLENQAYEDSPLPIGKGQTISQPYIVAYMTEALELTGGRKSWKSVRAADTRPPSWRNFPKQSIRWNESASFLREQKSS